MGKNYLYSAALSTDSEIRPGAVGSGSRHRVLPPGGRFGHQS